MFCTILVFVVLLCDHLNYSRDRPLSFWSPCEGFPRAGASIVDDQKRSSSVMDAPVVRQTVAPVDLDRKKNEEDDGKEHRSDVHQVTASRVWVETAAHAIKSIPDADKRSEVNREWRSSQMKEVVSALPVRVGETPSPLMTRFLRYQPGEGPRAHTQCPSRERCAAPLQGACQVEFGTAPEAYLPVPQRPSAAGPDADEGPRDPSIRAP